MIFRELAEAYQWASPSEVSKLTLYQVRMLLCSKTDLGGIQKVSEDEARRLGSIP